MLRKMFLFGALVVVAVTFGANGAMAKSSPAKKGHDRGSQTDGFSDGRV
jgi:hypothetical protein